MTSFLGGRTAAKGILAACAAHRTCWPPLQDSPTSQSTRR